MRMKINKTYINFFLVVVVGIFLLLSASVSAATSTINTPATDGIIAGSTIINITINGLIVDTEAMDFVNVSYYMKSATTSNSTWSLIGVNDTLNISLNGNESSFTFDTLIFEDANDYIFNVTVINASGPSTEIGGATLTTSIDVDNTVPYTPSSLSPTGTQTNNTLSFLGTIVGVNVTGCTLYFDGTNPGESSYTMTHTGNTCSYSKSSTPEQTYKWYIRASDGTNTSDSSVQTVNVDIKTGAGASMTAEQAAQAKAFAIAEGDGKIGTTAIILIIVGILVMGFILKKRK